MGRNLRDELLEFERRHPEVQIAPLMKVFHTCRGKRAKSFQEAYDHIYGTPNPGHSCLVCQKRMKEEELLNKLDAGYGRWDV